MVKAIRKVVLSVRRSEGRNPITVKTHPSRPERDAHLHISTTCVRVERPPRLQSALPEVLAVNVVRVWEPAPPAGQEPIESYTGLLNVLAVFLPIAYQLLLLRSISRSSEPLPAQMVLTPTQLAVLAAATRTSLPDNSNCHRRIACHRTAGPRLAPRQLPKM